MSNMSIANTVSSGSQTLAFSKGAKQPSKIALEFKRLSPRERALAVFTLLGSWGRDNAVLN
jgi:hypothetical protein